MDRYKVYTKLKQWIPVLVLLLYPLRHAFTGVDMMDAGYALGNYRFFDTMNETWKLATYLANVAGMLLLKLPLGNTWAGMNIYTGLFIGITAACVYLFMVKRYGNRLLVFVAEFVALSLCWAPSVVLYHYLGYILMTFAVCVLYQAITGDDAKQYIIAGIILGICVLVRMPNITYMALILPVWYSCFLESRRGGGKGIIKRTGLCILGYAIGVLAPFGVICLRYGWDAYPKMVADLFGMTETATDYKPVSMVTAMFQDYIRYGIWFLLFLAYMMAGVIFFQSFSKVFKKNLLIKFELLCRGVYIAGFLVLLRFCYGRGMFGLDYAEYFCMYKWLTVFLLLVICLCIYVLSAKRAAAGDKLWAVFLLVIIFITPLGGNNGLYSIINNLFLVAPVFVHLLMEMLFCKDTMHTKLPAPEETCSRNDRESANWSMFSFKTVLYGMLLCVTVQSVLFGVCFIFHDSKPRPNMRLALPIESPANGMKTNAFSKEELERLAGYLKDNDLLDRKVILYGDIPALAYILAMEPAIYTTWIDLDSNSASRLKKELDAISADSDEPLPVVIYRADAYDAAKPAKAEMIWEFLEKNNYQRVYRGERYIVCIAD